MPPKSVVGLVPLVSAVDLVPFELGIKGRLSTIELGIRDRLTADLVPRSGGTLTPSCTHPWVIYIEVDVRLH